MAGTGKASLMAAAAFVAGLAALAPTETMAQIPFPMIPNFNFGPQHYRSGPSGPSHYSTRSRSRHEHEEDRTPDKSKERDATQPDATVNTSAPRQQQQTSSAPRDAAPPAGSSASASPPPSAPPPSAPPANKGNDEPAFQPSR
jgi:hypothetical protein